MTRSNYACLAALVLPWLVISSADAASAVPRLPTIVATEPPAPQPTAPVQRLLDDAGGQQRAGESLRALQSAEQAMSVARRAADAAGEARAQRARGLALEQLGRTADAVAAWEETAAAWQRDGDGPGQVEALARAGAALSAAKPAEAAALVTRAAALGQAEAKRPLAAASALQEGGAACEARQRLDMARPLFAAAVSLREKLAPDSVMLAESLGSLGTVAAREGELAIGQEYLERALRLLQKLAPDSRDLAAALNNLGLLADRRGDLAAARAYDEQALELWEKLAPDSLDLAGSLSNLGMVAQEHEDLPVAREYYHRALRIKERLAPDSLSTASILGNLGVVARDQGDLAQAREYQQWALAIEEKLAPDSPAVANALNNLGAVAQDEGDLAAARDYYQHALELWNNRAPGSLNEAIALNNLGMVASEQGDMAAAQAYLARALAVRVRLAPQSLDLAATLDNLGNVVDALGNRSAALQYRRALAIDEKLAPGFPLSVAAVLQNLGVDAYEQGSFPVARHDLERALAMTDRVAPNSLAAADPLLALGVVAQKQGDFPAAKGYCRRALRIEEKLTPDSSKAISILSQLGLLAEKEGDWREAERLARQVWALRRHQEGSVVGDEARQAFGVVTSFYAANLVRAQIALGQRVPALQTLEEGRAQALQQLLVERHLDVSTAPSSLRAAYQAAVMARNHAEQTITQVSIARARREMAVMQETPAVAGAQSQKQAALTAATRQLAAAVTAYTQARVTADRLWAAIRQHAPRAFITPLSLSQARQALPPGTLFLAFSAGDAQSFLFVLRSGHAGRALALSVYPLPVTLPHLRERVLALKSELTDPDADPSAIVAASRALAARVLPAAARAPIQVARRLLISPDGPLWEVPFAALVTNAHGPPQYLGIEKPITYTSSLTLFAMNRKNRPRPVPGKKLAALVVGDPIFARKALLIARAPAPLLQPGGERALLLGSGAPPPPLPGTAVEAAAIARLYGTHPLTGEAATEAAVRQRLGSADIVHLATHGYFDPTWPMSSGVLLTVPQIPPAVAETANDGVLQAWEIFSQLHLRAELVVLSACDTGRGQNVSGEGIVGLTRALQYAGARAIVASQWAVADTSTGRLMVAFHRALRQGLPKDEALRQATARLRQDRRTAAPYYWAPFFLTSDPGPLPFAARPVRRPPRRSGS